MKKFFLLTAFGKDRSGIVAALTRVLYDVGANIEDAAMTRLGGEFSVMMMLSLPKRVSPSLTNAIGSLKRKFRLTVELKAIPPGLAQSASTSAPQALLSVYGVDHPGIVYRVADYLARHSVNITDLQTKILARPKGKDLYIMLMEVQLPTALTLVKLQAAMQTLSEMLGVDITVQDIEPVAL